MGEIRENEKGKQKGVSNRLAEIVWTEVPPDDRQEREDTIVKEKGRKEEGKLLDLESIRVNAI
jgi:hypothetical protein